MNEFLKNTFFLNALMLTDGYKIGHKFMEANGLTKLVTNCTPRMDKRAPKGCKKVTNFGENYVMKYINDKFVNDFFNRPKDDVCGEMKHEMTLYLGVDYDVTHFEELHDLQYLPIELRTIEEGNEVPFGVPLLTISNTHQHFAWVTNYLETIFSSMSWQPITTATIARSYHRTLAKWALRTDPESIQFVDYQGHDFSMRGMGGESSFIGSGLAHATSFIGSDTLPVIPAARYYYNAQGVVIQSVSASEHAIMCQNISFFIWDKYDNNWDYIGEAEFDTFKKLMTEDCPTGILSIVCDTINTWVTIFDFMKRLKDVILTRDGKIVLRPDSSRHSPVEVISGYKNFTGDIIKDENGWYLPLEKTYLYSIDGYEIEYKGVVEALWDIFGGTLTGMGYKKLDEHIGMLYGEANNNERIDRTSQNLADKGFTSTNTIYGCGSVGYQFQTRDTFSLAFKGTYAEINGHGIELFKDPITDKGGKKSARGLVAVFKDESGEYYLKDRATIEEYENSELKLVYRDGVFINEPQWQEVRDRIKNS